MGLQKDFLNKSMWPITLLVGAILSIQGLYFSYQWLAFSLLIYGILFIWAMGNQGLLVPKSVTTYYLVAMSCLHLLAYVYVAERGMLAFGVLKFILLLSVYLLLRQPSMERFYDKLIIGFVMVMAFMAWLSIVAMMTGSFRSMALVVNDRLSGNFQYANTMAVMCGVAVLLSLNKSWKVTYKLVAITGLVVAMCLTFSRGGILLSMVIIGVYALIEVRDYSDWLIMAISMIAAMIFIQLIGDRATVERLAVGVENASEWQTRLLYYKDGLTMLKDRWYGFGSNGYFYHQSFYQTGSTYHVKYIHSGLLQIGLDVGIIASFISAFWMAYSVIKQKDWAKRCGLTLIVIHSCIDFDLQYVAVWLVVILLSINVSEPTPHRSWQLSNKLVAASLGCLILLTGYFLTANIYYENEDYQEAVHLYPWYTEAYRKLMLSDEEADDLAMYAGELIQLNPYVTEGYEPLRLDAIAKGQYETALMYSEMKVYYSPLLIENHETYSRMLLLNATYAHSHEDDAKAKTYLQSILMMPDELAKLANKKDTAYNVKHKPQLTMNQVLMKDYVEAGHLIDEIQGQ